MARKEFPLSVKLACKARATRDGVAYCEKCGEPTKTPEIDHVIPDRQGGKPILGNAELLCAPCHAEKTAIDAGVSAKVRRQEAAHAGLTRPSGRIQSRGFSKKARQPREPVPRRHIFRNVA